MNKTVIILSILLTGIMLTKQTYMYKTLELCSVNRFPETLKKLYSG